MRFAVASCGLVASVAGHGAVTFPKPRNSVDGTLAPWTSFGQGCDYPSNYTGSGAGCDVTFCTTGKGCEGSCAVSAHSGVKGALNGSNGQACYWFSNVRMLHTAPVAKDRTVSTHT